MKRRYGDFVARAGVSAAASLLARKRWRKGSGLLRPAKRPRVATRSATRRRRRYMRRSKRRSKSEEDTGADLSRMTGVYGRKLRYNLRGAWKMIRSATEKTIVGLHLVSQFGGQSGFAQLGTLQTAPGQELIAPLQVFDVTSMINLVGGSLVKPTARWRLKFSNETDTATASFDGFNNWEVEQAPNLVTAYDNYRGVIVTGKQIGRAHV